jgi:hypothetical protein
MSDIEGEADLPVTRAGRLVLDRLRCMLCLAWPLPVICPSGKSVDHFSA